MSARSSTSVWNWPTSLANSSSSAGRMRSFRSLTVTWNVARLAAEVLARVRVGERGVDVELRRRRSCPCSAASSSGSDLARAELELDALRRRRPSPPCPSTREREVDRERRRPSARARAGSGALSVACRRRSGSSCSSTIFGRRPRRRAHELEALVLRPLRSPAAPRSAPCTRTRASARTFPASTCGWLTGVTFFSVSAFGSVVLTIAFATSFCTCGP